MIELLKVGKEHNKKIRTEFSADAVVYLKEVIFFNNLVLGITQHRTVLTI